jgi:hypothetical protein
VTLATVTAPPTAAVPLDSRVPVARAHALAAVRAHGAAVTVGVACAWWLIAAPRMWGGRGTGAITIGALLSGVAVLATRPQRVLPARVIWCAVAVTTAALSVALFSPTGWAGAPVAATYAAVAWTAVAVMAAIIEDERVSDALTVLLMVGVLVEVAESWLAWWGGANAANPITGTFNWYDPFAAYLLAGTVVGFAEFLRRDGVMANLGLATAVLGSIGLVYSTSRAADAAFFAAIAAVGGMHLLARGIRGLVRVGLGVSVMACGVWGIGGPPFFADRVMPFAGTAARASGQSLGRNGGYRLEFWHEAVGVFGRHPVVGGGFHSLATESAGHVPQGWVLSPLAHNGYLQVLSDGGLVLAAPVLLAAAVVAWWVVRLLATAVRTRDVSVAGFVAPLALGALLAHSVVDFDWSYAADFALVGVLIGMVGGRWLGRRDVVRPRKPSRLLSAIVLGGVVLTGVVAAASWSGDLRLSLPVSHTASHGGIQ